MRFTVAILIMILATASVIAIVKPKIYYDIKEMIDRWRITFSVEGESEENSFEPIKPVIPEGFEIVSEEIGDFTYSLKLRNREGKEIIYDQSTPDGMSIILDSENHTTRKGYYKNHEIVISKSDEVVTILCEDSKYGIYFGQNAISKNMMIADRRKLLNGNSFILGVSGAGKSFTGKNEITNLMLSSNADIIIIDPEREYAPLVRALGGSVIEISATSPNHINQPVVRVKTQCFRIC